MDSKNALREIFKNYDPEIIKLYSNLLRLEKESLNNRNENAVIQSILQRIKGDLE